MEGWSELRFTDLIVVFLLVAVTLSASAQPPEETATEGTEPSTEGTGDTEASETLPDAGVDAGSPTGEIPGGDATDEVIVFPEDPAGVLQLLYESLKAGDGPTVLLLISSEALENVEMMLESLQDELDRDTEAAMSRLVSAGYTATADEVEDWDAEDYLAAAVAVPRMKSRYVIYEMQIGEYTIDGDELEVPLNFTTATGTEFPFLSELVLEDGTWKVSTFMGLNSLP